MTLLRDQGLPSKEFHYIFHALVVSKIRYTLPAWRGFLSVDLVGQMSGFYSMLTDTALPWMLLQ